MREVIRMTRGFLSIVLHAHLPFVKHSECEDSLEQRWLFQAITDSYIPLLDTFERLAGDGIPFRIAVSLSPPLLEMLTDEVLRQRYKRYLENLIDLSGREKERLRGNTRLESLASMYHTRFTRIYEDFTGKYREDLVSPWSRLERSGRVELLTSAATHGYLPLLLHKEAIGVQIKAGARAFRRMFNHDPVGFWLPECAYVPEVEPYLSSEGVRYFILETHGVLYATPRPRFGFHAPVMTPHKLLAFGRDPDCSKQVWSADEGYPGDPRYREFYRDIGYELPLEYLGNALPGSTRVPVGIKYFRVTDRKTDDKDLYDPEAARRAAWEHAGNFLFWRNKEAEYWQGILGRRPIMVAPYDAELFGHWWFEGPLWLEFLLRRMASENQQVITITPSEYAEYYPVNQVSKPAVSSWGYKGYHEVWLEGSNDWIYRHLHHCQEQMIWMARKHKRASGLLKRALNQAAREILLAQSSDWPFIMKSGTVPEYARNRFITHIGRFRQLIKEVENGAVDPVFLRQLETWDSVFPDIDYAEFAGEERLPA